MPKTSDVDFWRNLKHVIKILGDTPKHRTEWTLKSRLKYGITTHQFNRILKIALNEEYVKRIGRGEYKLTKKGSDILLENSSEIPNCLAMHLEFRRWLARRATTN
jgi:predicted transcriptional regulator